MVLGLTEWREERDRQLLKETSLLFYYLENRWIKRLIIIILFCTILIVRDDYKINVFISWAVISMLIIIYSFWVQHKINLKKDPPGELLKKYIEYRKSVNCPL